MLDFLTLLRENPYPGRGILVSRDLVYYFIMGRSANSRNRIFVTTGDGIRTEAYDPAKLEDPSLIIYNPVLTLGKTHIVTNGDQTDTIYDFLQKGKSFEDALRTRTFEPDGPNFTPRISGVVELENNCYKLSILKSADGDESSTRRYFFDYDAPRAGEGHFIHTYEGDGNPLPSFEGEPTQVKLDGDIDAFTALVWNALNEDNKVSLFTRYIDLESGETETRIVNKNQE